MKTKLLKRNSDDLIVFFSGWGCDENSYKDMDSSRDVLICWDYTSLDLIFNFSEYKKYYLIAYSAGVFVSCLVQDKLPKFDYKIAINGNPKLFDNKYGISSDIVEIFKGLNLENYMNFRLNYLVRNTEELEYFNSHQPHRTFESCFEELDKLKEYYTLNYKNIEYDKAIIAAEDKIFIPDAQAEYYNGKCKILENSAHDVFYIFRNFDDILIFTSL